MSQVAHSERKHALLGASSADRWINCPPSARLTESIADKGSEYADEGTAAHEYSELWIRKKLFDLKAKDRKTLDVAIEKFKAVNQYYNPEMEHAVQDYVDIVAERFMAAKARSKDAILLLEEEVDFTEWVPEGKGLNDVVIIADRMLEVIDLKYGKGVPVYATGNPQTRLYGLGAYNGFNWLYDIQEICMTIVQPRLDSISSETLSIVELIDWAETVVKPAAELAFAGKGEFKAGEHCKWCKVKATCRVRADENLKALEYEFQDPALMTNDEIGQILFVAQQLKTWANDVEAYAFDQAKAGNRIPLWKLVEGRSNRAITDKEAAKDKLLAAGFEADKILKPQELFGITDLETKIVGKKMFKELLSELIIKPQGKPVLVPETDPRVEMNSIEEDFADIDMEA